jgi:hypothetical protein
MPVHFFQACARYDILPKSVFCKDKLLPVSTEGFFVMLLQHVLAYSYFPSPSTRFTSLSKSDIYSLFRDLTIWRLFPTR